MRSRSVLLFTALAALTLFLFLLDLAVGAVAVPLGDVWAALTGGDCPRATAKIILNIRLIKAGTRCWRVTTGTAMSAQAKWSRSTIYISRARRILRAMRREKRFGN